MTDFGLECFTSYVFSWIPHSTKKEKSPLLLFLCFPQVIRTVKSFNSILAYVGRVRRSLIPAQLCSGYWLCW